MLMGRITEGKWGCGLEVASPPIVFSRNCALWSKTAGALRFFYLSRTEVPVRCPLLRGRCRYTTIIERPNGTFSSVKISRLS